MSPILREGRNGRRWMTPSSFPKDRTLVRGGGLFGRGAPRSVGPLSPLDREILSACLRSTDDPWETGILAALLSAERRGEAS